MYNYIFDLDFTLYSKYNIDQTTDTKYYKSIGPNIFLNKLLNQLNGNKYIFSNGNKSHVDFVLDKMKLNSFFIKIATLDDYPYTPKPHIKAYNYIIETFNMDLNKKFFFEDTLENLEPAKKLGWVTIYINNDGLKESKINTYKFIDYKFSCIEQALLFFINTTV